MEQILKTNFYSRDKVAAVQIVKFKQEASTLHFSFSFCLYADVCTFSLVYTYSCITNGEL